MLLSIACTESRQQSLLKNAEDKAGQGRYAEAAELYRKAIAINPESKTAIKALYKLGFTLETYLKEYEGAVFNFLEFIRLSKDVVSVYEVQKRVANIYFDQNKENDKVIAAYKRLIDLNPNSLEIDLFQFRIAQSYFRSNNFEQARMEYGKLLENYPKSQFASRTRFEIGNTYYMEGKYDIAQEALKQVLRHHPQSEFALEAEFLIAQCLEQTNHLAPALETYEKLKPRYSSPEIIQFRIVELKKRIRKEK